MPGIGQPLRGHELAKDGLVQLVACDTVMFRGVTPGDIRVLRPASADNEIWSVATPDQGQTLPITATRVSSWVNWVSGDPAMGTLTLQLFRNGVTGLNAFTITAAQIPGGGLRQQLLNAAPLRFLAGETWEWLFFCDFGGGVGLEFNVVTAFYL